MRSCRLRPLLLITVLLPLSSVRAFLDVAGRIPTPTISRQPTLMQAGAVVDLDDSNKDAILADDRTVLIDAYATFCGPCKLIEPVIERCAANREDMDFARYNVEAANVKELKLDLLMQKTVIRKLPTLIMYSHGKVVSQHSGLLNYEEVLAFISNALHNDTEEENTTSSSSSSSTKSRGKISFGSTLDRDDYALGA